MPGWLPKFFFCTLFLLFLFVCSLVSGLDKARGYLETIQKNHPSVSWADLIQLASATAIEMAGGVSVADSGWGAQWRAGQCLGSRPLVLFL